MQAVLKRGLAIVIVALLAVCLIPTLSFAATTSAQTSNNKTITRYAGVDRYDTSALVNIDVAKTNTYSGVIVCSAANGKFADALCAAGLSGMLDYPVVLVDGTQNTLDSTARYTISSLTGNNRGDIIVLGGSASISEGIANDLSEFDSDSNVMRLWGADRYATSEQIYNYGVWRGNWSTDYAVVAKGNDFPDALGAASFCTANAAPMLLTDQNDVSLPSYALNAAAQTSQVVIVGGTSSVSAEKGDVLKNYASVVRIGGSTRYETNISFATWELNHGMRAYTVGVATGESFPDALGSGYLLSQTNSPLLLASTDDVSNSSLYTFMWQHADNIATADIFGGTSSVPDYVESTITNILETSKSDGSYPSADNGIAAFGNIALIVQMVGGAGALAATDAETLAGMQSAGVDTGGAVSAWTSVDGDPSSIDAYAIVNSGAKIVLLDEDSNSYIKGLSWAVYNYLIENNIQFVTLDPMSTSNSIKEDVTAVGEMLQGSSSAYGSIAKGRASEYCEWHDNMMNINDGLAQDDSYYENSKELQSETSGLGYSGNPTTHTVLINYWDDTASLVLSGITFDPGAAYSSAGYGKTPISLYIQAGGTINTAASRSSVISTGEIPVLQFTGSDGSKNASSWSNTQLTNINYNNGNGYHALLDSGVNAGGSTALGKGFGSEPFPKIIVTSSSIKDSIVNNSASENSLYHPYNYMSGGIFSGALGVSGTYIWTCIGNIGTSGAAGDPNPIYPDGYIYPEDVLVNPQGYFCDWTQGTVESFLETGFVAAYINGDTTGYTRDQWRRDVSEFYNWAWGINPDMDVIDPNGAECVN